MRLYFYACYNSIKSKLGEDATGGERTGRFDVAD